MTRTIGVQVGRFMYGALCNYLYLIYEKCATKTEYKIVFRLYVWYGDEAMHIGLNSEVE